MIGECEIVARSFRFRCQDARGLRAGATIAVLGGLRAERRPIVAITEQKSLSLPTETQYKAASDAQQAALRAALDVTSQFRQMREAIHEGSDDEMHVERPITHGDVGRLYAWLTDVRRNVGEMNDYIADAEEALVDLEVIRAVHPDA
jgi:hypothetical protein